jgi:hypothetical protein
MMAMAVVFAKIPSADSPLRAPSSAASADGFSLKNPSSTKIFVGVTLSPQSKITLRKAPTRSISSPIPYTDHTKKTLDSGSIPVNPRLFHPSTDKNYDFSMFTGC